MGLNPPVPQQDSNWEIRVAVLLSLFLQVLLIFLGSMRKRSASPIPRFIVWSCYLLADWVADLGLGLILNNMGNIGGGADNSSGSSSSPVIFAFWTPFLLLHLGGPDTITAYSLEDNELWLRHLIGLLFELFSATVVIFCSLQNNPLISATMLMLVAGVIKYGERTYSLYSGSIGRLRDNMMDPPYPGLDYAKLMGELDTRKKAGEDLAITIAESAHKDRLEMMQELQSSVTVKSLEVRAYELFLIFQRIFVDVIISFQQRMNSRAFFVEQPDLKPKEALEVMQLELGFMYDTLYTKAPIAHTWKGWVLRSICSSCLVSALVIFFLLDKPRHQVRRVDVGITYALLLGGLALDAAALIMLFFSNRMVVFLEQQQQQSTKWLAWLARLSQTMILRLRRRHRSSWSGVASQMNLIHYCLEKPGPYNNNNSGDGGGGAWKNHRWLMHMIAKMLRTEEMFDDLVFIQHVELIFSNVEDPYAGTTLEFIFDSLKHIAHNVGNNKESIKQVCNRRGTGVLQHLREEMNKALKNDQDKLKVIMESVENKDLDESLLLWHIATDLCLLCKDAEVYKSQPAGPQVEDEDSQMLRMRAISKVMSEYMLYLLIKEPDMLSATAGIGLRPYRDTCAEARRFFASSSTSMSMDNDSHEDARQALLRVNTSEKPMKVKGDRSKSMLFDGVILAKVVMELGKGLMWRLLAGVWVEMITFAAVSGRGSIHLRNLNRGGELITIVWLLMQHMGLSDKYEIQQEDPLLQLLPLPPPPLPSPLRKILRPHEPRRPQTRIKRIVGTNGDQADEIKPAT